MTADDAVELLAHWALGYPDEHATETELASRISVLVNERTANCKFYAEKLEAANANLRHMLHAVLHAIHTVKLHAEECELLGSDYADCSCDNARGFRDVIIRLVVGGEPDAPHMP
jgi:hypothetical protein